MSTESKCRIVGGDTVWDDDMCDWTLLFECGNTTYGVSRKDYLKAPAIHFCNKRKQKEPV